MAHQQGTKMETRTFIMNSLAEQRGQPVSSIDTRASFLELGGNSLRAVVLHSACKERGIELPVSAIVTSPTIDDLVDSARLSPTSPSTPSAAKKFVTGLATPPDGSRRGSPAYSRTPALSSLSEDSHRIKAPITNMQLSLLHGGEKNPGTNIISYHEEYSLRDLPRMKHAWATVVESEPIFRLIFDFSGNGEGMQTEVEKAPFPWSETTVQSVREYQSQIQSQNLPESACTSLAVTILRSPSSPEQSRCTISWRIHHALIDGYSRDLLLNKVRRVAAGRPISPGHSFVSLARQLGRYRAQHKLSARQFWKDQDQNYPSASGALLLSAPTNTSRASRKHNKTISLSIPARDVQAYANQCGITYASVIHGAWAMVLSKYADSDCVEFGTILSGRSTPLDHIATTIGPMINTLPFRSKLDQTMATKDYLRQVCHEMLELVSYEWSTPEDGFERRFSTVVAVEGIAEIGLDPHVGVKPISVPYATIESDMLVTLRVRSDGAVEFKYNVQAYHDNDMRLMGKMFCDAISALRQPEATIGECSDSLLPLATRDHLLSLGNCISPLTSASSIDQDLVTLFEAAARENPSAFACQQGDHFMTYAELDAAATHVASYLAAVVEPGEVVCLRPARSFSWMVGMYGILKAGAIYSPLDGALPLSIQDDNFTTASARVFLTAAESTDDLAASWIPSGSAIARSVDDILSDKNQYAPVSHRTTPKPGASAYLCFTSGSSGKPKGVICTHEGLVAFQRNEEVRLFANPGKRISQIMSPAFDGSIHEIFSALSYGATLVWSNNANPFDVLQEVDSCILTPSIANVLDPSHYPELKNVYLVGEPVPETVSTRWALQKDLYNMYGPTETTCGATIKKLLPSEPVSLGVPQPSMRIYILDKNRALAPPGVTGEICLAGVQVAHGYIGRPEETARSFMADPILSSRGERMYCTGDLGYWDKAGELVCLGRNDRQVKLQGFRLNLNDLETRVCRAMPTIKAIAIARNGDALAAMVEPSCLDREEVRSKMQEVLPAYAMPRHIVTVDSFPKTNAGKIDYKAVAKAASEATTLERKALTTPTAHIIAAMWRDILHLAENVEVDEDSDFVDYGGDSIKQLRLSSALKQQFGCHIPMYVIIENNILGSLSRAIDELLRDGPRRRSETPEHVKPLGHLQVSPIEAEWYAKTKSTEHSSAFNVSYACTIGEEIDRVKLAKSWNVVLARYRILSSRYIEKGGSVVRKYGAQPPRARRCKSLNLRREINRPFSLGSEDPIRVMISSRKLLIVVHHIVCDLTTLKILTREMAAVYSDEELPPVSTEYSDVTRWSGDAPTPALEFWSRYLDPTAAQTHDLNATPRRDYSGCSHLSTIPTALYHEMVDYSVGNNVTLHQLALAAVAVALQPEASSVDITLGAPFLNRTSAEEMDTVGLFLEPLPVRIQYQETPKHGAHRPTAIPSHLSLLPSPPMSPFGSRRASPSIQSEHGNDDSNNNVNNPLLDAVAQSSQAALAHAVPWNQLLSHLSINPSFPNHPLFDTMVTFLDQGSMPSAPLPGLDPLYVWTEGAKFKLMAEFMAASDDSLLLRCEYDTGCYSNEEIKEFESKVREALAAIVHGDSFEEVKRAVKAGDEKMEIDDTSERVSLFAQRVDEL